MTPTLYLTFHDVAGDPWQGQATARFQGELGEQPIAIREGMTRAERDEVRWYIEEFMDLPEGGNLRRARDVEEALEVFGRHLWNCLAGPAAERWLRAVHVAGAGRLELSAATQRDEAAFRSPWELLRVAEKGDGSGPLLHQLGVTLVRRVDAHLAQPQLPDTSRGLRVLTVVCRPEEAGFLDPRYTPEAILDALGNRSEVELDFCRPGTVSALVNSLEAACRNGHPYHVVHFDGHGTTLAGEGGVGALCFEDAEGRLQLVRAPELGELLSRLDVPLVVLEACRTATMDFAQNTVASALLRKGVGTVVAMGHAVHIDLTRELMAGFYGSIGDGATLGEALQAARNRVYAQPERRTRIAPDAPTVALCDWFVPQLYQGGKDPRLLPKKPPRRRRRPEPVFAGFPPTPRSGFQARGHTLHRLERALGTFRAVFVHAPGGMGKTALAREAAVWWVRTGFFPDGAVFVSLEGNPSPERLVALVGEALAGIEFHRMKKRAAWLEGQLNRRRLLLVWDNYESVLPAFNADRPAPPEFAQLARKWTAGGSRLLVTCRSVEVGLEAQPFCLGELSRVEGLTLLVAYLDRLGFGRQQRAEASWAVENLASIVLRTGGHPLSLELLAPPIARFGPERVLEDLAHFLAASEQDSPERRNQNLKASLEVSLKSLSPWVRELLPSVALLAGGCLDKTAQRVVGLNVARWLEMRRELESTGLVQFAGTVFRPHPTLAEVADLISEVDPATKERFVRTIARFVFNSDRLVHTKDAHAGLKAMAISEVVARRAARTAAATGLLEMAFIITDAMGRFLELTGRASEARTITNELVSITESKRQQVTQVTSKLTRRSALERGATDPEGAVLDLLNLLVELRGVRGWDARYEQASTLSDLGVAYSACPGRLNEAIEPLNDAVRIFQELEAESRADTHSRAAALGDLAGVLSSLARYTEALTAAEESLHLNRDRGDPQAVGRSEFKIAVIYSQLGQHAASENAYLRALEAARTAGDDELIGVIWQKLGVVALDSQRFTEAEPLLRNAVAAFQRSGNEQGLREAFNALGVLEANRGRHEVALAWFDQVIASAKRTNALRTQSAALSNRARVLYEMAQKKNAIDESDGQRLLREATSEVRAALAIEEEIGLPEPLARSHINLAGYLQEAGLLDDAEQHSREALRIWETTESADTWKACWLLGQIAESQGQIAEAEDWRERARALQSEARRQH